MDSRELGTSEYRRALDRSASELEAANGPAAVDRARERVLAEADAFLTHQNRYLQEREEEFRLLISLLIEAAEAMARNNQTFNRGLLVRFGQVEGVAQLQDLRQMREALSANLQSLKSVVRQKDQVDVSHITSLRQQVKRLEGRLQEAEQRAQTDPATGAYNRRALNAYLEALVARNDVSPQPFSLILCDMDDLKRINDECGHPIGDRAILALVQTLRSHVRRDDFVARYGGDEFVVVLPGLVKELAEKKARQLLQALRNTVYYYEQAGRRERLQLRASLGISVYRPGDTPHSLIDRADKALYRAKHAGKSTARMEA